MHPVGTCVFNRRNYVRIAAHDDATTNYTRVQKIIIVSCCASITANTHDNEKLTIIAVVARIGARVFYFAVSTRSRRLVGRIEISRYSKTKKKRMLILEKKNCIDIGFVVFVSHIGVG